MDQESSSVYSRFRDYFTGPGVEEIPERTEESELAYMQEVRDARAFVGTSAYGKYRAMIVSAIEAQIPDPSGGTDAAAACAFMQAGLRKALQILDTVSSFAREDPDA